MRVEVERSVRRGSTIVFAFFSNPDAYVAAHRDHCRSLTFHERSRSSAVVEEEWWYAGRTYRIRHRVRVVPPRHVILDTVAGVGTGARERISIEPVPPGTRIRYEVTYTLPGPFRTTLEALLVPRVRSIVEDLADADVRALERAALGWA